jgi:hypothetical protein
MYNWQTKLNMNTHVNIVSILIKEKFSKAGIALQETAQMSVEYWKQ